MFKKGTNEKTPSEETNEKTPSEEASGGVARCIFILKQAMLPFALFVCVSNYKKRKDR